MARHLLIVSGGKQSGLGEEKLSGDRSTDALCL